MKEYLIIGSNNFWYSTCSNKKEVANEIKNISEAPGYYGDPETGYRPEKPKKIFVYKAKLIN